MKAGTPFKRLNVFVNAIQALLAMDLPPHLHQREMAKIGPYVSHGKGRNKSAFGSKKGAHMAFVRNKRR